MQVKYSLSIADFHRLQANAGCMHGQCSSFIRSTPELYSRVIYIAAPAALPTKNKVKQK